MGAISGLSSSTLTLTTESIRIDETSATVNYYGFAEPGTLNSSAGWKILRLTISGSLQTFEFANGLADYTNIWNNRASLSYS